MISRGVPKVLSRFQGSPVTMWQLEPRLSREIPKTFQHPQPDRPGVVTARFGPNENPLADARGSDGSPDRERGVARNSPKSRGMGTRAYSTFHSWMPAVCFGSCATSSRRPVATTGVNVT